MKPEFAWSFVLARGACAMGPDYREPIMTAPAHWRVEQNAGLDLKPLDPESLKSWWRRFGDSPLGRLMEQALGGNLDLRMALTRIDQARAERRAIRAELFPSVNLATGVARYSNALPGLVPPIRFNFFQLGFDALWEIDVFGRQCRRLEAASADLDAGTEQDHQVLVILTSDVARGYIEYRNLQNQQRITRANLDAQRHTLGLTERLLREWSALGAMD